MSPFTRATPATRRTHLRAAVALTLMLASISQAALAEKRSFRIDAQDAAAALMEFGKQAGLQILFAYDRVKGFKTNSLDGSYEPLEAVRMLVEGTGLQVREQTTDVLVIEPRESSSSEANGSEAARWSDGGATRIKLAAAQDLSGESAPTAQRREQERMALQEVTLTVPEVLVLGKRTLNADIARTEDDPQPYVVFDRQALQQSSAQNLEAFLRDRLPMNAGGLANGLRVTQYGAQSQFNLRGLGANQTLILVDGRRLPSGPAFGATPGQANINGIPLAAIERIEVLPATASGIYGGSATGGVINIVMRQDYAGAEATLSYGNSFKSDVATRRVDLSAGASLEDGKTNILITSSFTDQNALTLRERPELVERYYNVVRSNAPEQLMPPNNPPLGSTPNIRSADGSDLVLRDGTSLHSPITHIPEGYAGTATDGGAALVANAGSYNFGLADSIQALTGGRTQLGTKPRNVAFRASLRREFLPWLQSFLEGSVIETEAVGPLVATQGTALIPYTVLASAPNNPFANDILVTVPSASFAGPIENKNTQHRVTAGLVASLPGNWQAGLDYTWARTRDRIDGSSYTPTGADTLAVMDGSVDVLRDTQAFPVDLAALLPPGPVASVQNIRFDDVVLRFAGPVFELPGGPVGFSTLLEYRSDEYSDTLQRLPYGFDLQYPARSASATSVYLETRVPLVSAKNRRKGVEALELQLAVRGDEYRTHGTTGFVIVGTGTPIVSASNVTESVNPTIALKYQPFDSLALRSSYGTGFVAPDVSQLAQSISASPNTIIDPRRGNTVTTLPVGQVLQGGNPNLGPEESESWSVGLLWTPPFVAGLRVSLDYLRVRKTDNIAFYPTGVQGLVNDEALFPDRIQRGANLPGDPAGWAGPITFLDVSLLNIARAEVEAFDLQLDYSYETDFGTFTFSSVATRQTHLRTTAVAGQPTFENVGMSYSNPQKLVGNAELKWQYRGWSAGWLARHYDAYLTANPALPGNLGAIALQGHAGRVPSQTYHDLAVSWDTSLSGRNLPGVLEGMQFQLNIRNVFDKLPPFDAYSYSQWQTLHSPLGDPIGSSYQFAVTKRF